MRPVRREALASKAPPLMKKINMMIHLNRPMSEQALTTSYSLRVLYRTSGRWINLGALNDFPHGSSFLLSPVIGPAVCNVKSLVNECQFGNL